MRELSDRGELPRCWFLVSVMSCTQEPSYGDLRRWLSGAIGRISEQTQPASEPLQSDGSMDPGSDQ